MKLVWGDLNYKWHRRHVTDNYTLVSACDTQADTNRNRQRRHILAGNAAVHWQRDRRMRHSSVRQHKTASRSTFAVAHQEIKEGTVFITEAIREIKRRKSLTWLLILAHNQHATQYKRITTDWLVDWLNFPLKANYGIFRYFPPCRVRGCGRRECPRQLVCDLHNLLAAPLVPAVVKINTTCLKLFL